MPWPVPGVVPGVVPGAVPGVIPGMVPEVVLGVIPGFVLGEAPESVPFAMGPVPRKRALDGRLLPDADPRRRGRRHPSPWTRSDVAGACPMVVDAAVRSSALAVRGGEAARLQAPSGHRRPQRRPPAPRPPWQASTSAMSPRFGPARVPDPTWPRPRHRRESVAAPWASPGAAIPAAQQGASPARRQNPPSERAEPARPITGAIEDSTWRKRTKGAVVAYSVSPSRMMKSRARNMPPGAVRSRT